MPFIQGNGGVTNNKRGNDDGRDTTKIAILSWPSPSTANGIVSKPPASSDLSMLFITDAEKEQAARLVRRKFKAAVCTVIAVNKLTYLGQKMLHRMKDLNQQNSHSTKSNGIKNMYLNNAAAMPALSLIVKTEMKVSVGGEGNHYVSYFSHKDTNGCEGNHSC